MCDWRLEIDMPSASKRKLDAALSHSSNLLGVDIGEHYKVYCSNRVHYPRFVTCSNENIFPTPIVGQPYYRYFVDCLYAIYVHEYLHPFVCIFCTLMELKVCIEHVYT